MIWPAQRPPPMHFRLGSARLVGGWSVLAWHGPRDKGKTARGFQIRTSESSTGTIPRKSDAQAVPARPIATLFRAQPGDTAVSQQLWPKGGAHRRVPLFFHNARTAIFQRFTTHASKRSAHPPCTTGRKRPYLPVVRSQPPAFRQKPYDPSKACIIKNRWND